MNEKLKNEWMEQYSTQQLYSLIRKDLNSINYMNHKKRKKRGPLLIFYLVVVGICTLIFLGLVLLFMGDIAYERNVPLFFINLIKKNPFELTVIFTFVVFSLAMLGIIHEEKKLIIKQEEDFVLGAEGDEIVSLIYGFELETENDEYLLLQERVGDHLRFKLKKGSEQLLIDEEDHQLYKYLDSEGDDFLVYFDK